MRGLGDVWATMGWILLGGVVALAAVAFCGSGKERVDEDLVNVSDLPAPDEALRREVDELRARLAELESRQSDRNGAAAAAAVPPAAAPPELDGRVARLEGLALELEEMLASRAVADPGEVAPADQKAVAQLVSQVLDPAFGMRVRIESLQLLAKVDPRMRPFGDVDLGMLGSFMKDIPGDPWRRKAYRSVRRQIDRSWFPMLAEAARREAVDEVRAEIIESMQLLAGDADVRVFLNELLALPGLGPKSRDAIVDLLR